MADLPPRSQWAPLLQKPSRKPMALRDEAEVQSAASDEAEVRADLALRLTGLKAALGKGLVLLPHECASAARCGAPFEAAPLVVALLPLIRNHPRARSTAPASLWEEEEADAYDVFEGHTSCSSSSSSSEAEKGEAHVHALSAMLRGWDKEEED